MNHTATVTAVIVAATFTIFGATIAARDDGDNVRAQAHLQDMQASARALQMAGEAMQRHGQFMRDTGRASTDEELITQGGHWLADGDELVQRARWLAMNPTAPHNLAASVVELRQDGSWGELNRRATQMLRDPYAAPTVDLEALRLNGAAMQAEGQLMVEHGRRMAYEVTVMIERHGLDAETAAELRASTAAMVATGEHLMQNGRAMIDYANQIARSIGK